MKLSEFDKIRKYLPDDVEITINGTANEYMTHPMTKQKVLRRSLEKQECGDHYGRYTVFCPVCGWISGDIRANEPMPTRCPNCGNGE